MTTQLPGDADDHFRLLRLSGLLTKEQLVRALEDFKKQAESDGSTRDLNALVKFLLDSKLVTPWQNQKLLGGKHKGFFLRQYKLLAHIAIGGTSAIFLAEHTILRRRVAIKILSQARAENATFMMRLHRVLQAVAALDHPHLVRIFDFDNEGKICFIVMEYVDGQDLRSVVADRGPLPFADAAEFIRQTADGLAHAHKRELIHHEINPMNLLLDKSRAIKVLKMGVGRILSEEQPTFEAMPHYEKLGGIYDYLSPEQGPADRPIDLRTDIYSLACTFYFLLTGHPPYTVGSIAQRRMQHHTSEPQPIVDVRPDVPQRLVEICRKMMAKKPDDRYQTCGEVRDALAGWLQDHRRS